MGWTRLGIWKWIADERVPLDAIGLDWYSDGGDINCTCTEYFSIQYNSCACFALSLSLCVCVCVSLSLSLSLFSLSLSLSLLRSQSPEQIPAFAVWAARAQALRQFPGAARGIAPRQTGLDHRDEPQAGLMQRHGSGAAAGHGVRAVLSGGRLRAGAVRSGGVRRQCACEIRYAILNPHSSTPKCDNCIGKINSFIHLFWVS